MSVLIKGIKMPVNGNETIIRIQPNGTILDQYGHHLIIKAVYVDDVVEQKKGKWIKMSDVDGIYWACSECGEDIPRIAHFNPQFDLFPKMESIDRTNYCPSCGAKMDRGQ